MSVLLFLSCTAKTRPFLTVATILYNIIQCLVYTGKYSKYIKYLLIFELHGSVGHDMRWWFANKGAAVPFNPDVNLPSVHLAC